MSCKTAADTHRYNLALSNALYEQMRIVADTKNLSVVEVVRQILRIGLVLLEAQFRGAKLIIREPDGHEVEVLIA